MTGGLESVMGERVRYVDERQVLSFVIQPY